MKGIVYGGLLSVVFVLSGCSGSQKEGRDSKEIPVEIVKVAKTVPADTRNYVGTVEEVVSSSISFQVMGNVERVLVGEGQKVREGQLLAVLDKATLENAYNASAASLRQAEDAYARMRTLHENKSLPDMKWVEVESKLEQARSMERISRKNLEDRNLYAPFGGVIGKRMVEAGENVQPGQPVFSLLRIETVNVKIAVPENEVATLGDQAAMIKVAALGGQCFEGKVTEKGIVANPISHTYEAKIRLENPSGALLPGMVCDVRLSGEESVPAIALPNNAVLIANDGGRFVWKVVDGKAKATPVRTGDLTERGLFIRNLYAPFGGVIGKRMVEAGENVQPGQPVFSLLRIETVNVKIAVPENEVATLGDQAAMIKVAALGGQCFEGKVTEKGIVANPISHTYEAKIRLENPSGALLPGMVCDVRLSGEESVPAIALPNNAVLIANDGGRFVWKVVDGKAKATPVRTGDLTERGLFILEGLNEGDIVVIGGYQKISEGMRVRAL